MPATETYFRYKPDLQNLISQSRSSEKYIMAAQQVVFTQRCMLQVPHWYSLHQNSKHQNHLCIYLVSFGELLNSK
jgi:hypothetical protein